MGQDFDALILAEFGEANTTPPPLNAVFFREDGTPIARVYVNADGMLDVEGDPADFTEAAEIFAEALMSAWQARMTGGQLWCGSRVAGHRRTIPRAAAGEATRSTGGRDSTAPGSSP
jgi:hypothetical protein